VNIGRWNVGRKALIAGAVLLAVVVAAGAAAAIKTAAAGQNGAAGATTDPARCGSHALRLTVSGTGVVTLAPNLLTLTLDVTTTGGSTAVALSANDAASTAILKALSEGGVAAKDISTTNLSIQPKYSETGSVVIGYSVDDTVVAKIRKLATAGTVIDAAVTAGGNATRINGLTFSLTNPAHAQDRARTLAVHEAVGHAKALATAAGEQLGAICKLTDETSPTPTPVPLPVTYGGVARAGPLPAGGVPVNRGTQTVTSHVSIVYVLTQATKRAR